MKKGFKLGWFLTVTLALASPAGLVADTQQGDRGLEKTQTASRRSQERHRGVTVEQNTTQGQTDDTAGVQTGNDLGLVKRGKLLAPEAGAPTSDNDDHGTESEPLVVLCHKPGTRAERTMMVPESAVPGHLGHGDTLGACGGDQTPTGDSSS